MFWCVFHAVPLEIRGDHLPNCKERGSVEVEKSQFQPGQLADATGFKTMMQERRWEQDEECTMMHESEICFSFHAHDDVVYPSFAFCSPA